MALELYRFQHTKGRNPVEEIQNLWINEFDRNLSEGIDLNP